ncbi:hypothetical protein ACCAA_1170022 [Candidatus Accumulibacter aalborgensis]|uniref:Uncharacterized protein n=1 Tax=Candidatus Accumulibacter aalborgensis TaxID=1860102 RepID=A0A1A8XFB2_9PROT|nr:hypothetical protein ACCAA_1170022 [Candidatus Accumulibacter aalborgensis]
MQTRRQSIIGAWSQSNKPQRAPTSAQKGIPDEHNTLRSKGEMVPVGKDWSPHRKCR